MRREYIMKEYNVITNTKDVLHGFSAFRILSGGKLYVASDAIKKNPRNIIFE